MQAVMAGWKAGDGTAMAKPFAKRARFVTFDGRLLVGPEAIAATHQQAFDTHLKGTVLRLKIDEVRALGDGVWTVFTTGGIGKADGSAVELVGDSIQTFLCREEGGWRDGGGISKHAGAVDYRWSQRGGVAEV